MARGLKALALPSGDEGLCDSLALYLAEIESWNPAYGLVKADSDELVLKHALDSLAALSHIRLLAAGIAASRGSPEAAGRAAKKAYGLAAPRLRLADIGSGAGLPGIPLALALPDFDVELVERMTKRVRFLEHAIAMLGLTNVRVVESQVERLSRRYDLVTFRAFRPFERKLFKRVFALCEKDGALLAYKGREEKARAELAAIEGLYSSARIIPLEVPMLDEHRCLVELRPAAI